MNHLTQSAQIEHQPDLDTLFASAHASACFALACLEPSGPHLRAHSTFVDPDGRPMHWHDFGDLEGPGWAANAVGGAYLLYRWGRYLGNQAFMQAGLRLVDHVLEDGFIQADRLIWPYYDLAKQRFCLNYTHNNAWLCPGSLAKIGVQLLELAALLGEENETGSSDRRANHFREVAARLADWLESHVPLLPDGWVPRRITMKGQAYPLDPHGNPDPIFDHSADGLYLLQLWALTGRVVLARRLGDAFVFAGGYWGSINHDTFDDHENVAYASAFRILRQVSERIDRPAWRDFAFSTILPAMQHFRMERDEHGVATRGLFWMEASWDTAYLWENAEVAQAYLEAWLERGQQDHRQVALEVLATIARHHAGELGFLSEGIDWNNHVSQRHHLDYAYYGAIRYTEPLLNNLHLLLPTLTCLESYAYQPPLERFNLSTASETDARQAVAHLRRISLQAGYIQAGKSRYLLRLYFPAIETDEGVQAVLAFARQAGIDGVMLFEAGYDTDPALLTLQVLEERFARLRAIVPRFRQAGLEVHINVMITMGHVDAGGAQPEKFPFQFLVDEKGNLSRSTACPLDPSFLDYAGQVYHLAASCQAEGVWVDDDVRFLGHDLPGMTCFCPLHLSEMTRLTGKTWTRKALVTALKEDSVPLRQAWFDLQEEAILNLAKRVELEVHAVDPRIRIGLMSVGSAIHSAEGRHMDRLLRVLSGPDNQPALRPGSGFWNDDQPAAVLVKSSEVTRQASFLGRDVHLVAEIENHPYSPFQKSNRILSLELALNALAGTTDLSLNLFSGSQSFSEGADQPEYASLLVRLRPFLDAITCARAGKLPVGIGVEASQEIARAMPLRGRPLATWVAHQPWDVILARLGLPVGQPQCPPHLLSGDIVHTIDQAALESLIQEGSVLTPAAARSLLELGWGKRLGLRGVQVAAPGVNECFTYDEMNAGYAGLCLPVRHYASQLHPYTYLLTEGGQARVLSRWLDVDRVDRGPGSLALLLPDGSRLGLLPYEPAEVTLPLLHPARREAWGMLFTWVGRRDLVCRVTEGVNLVTQVFVDPVNRAWLLAVINLSADDADGILAGPLSQVSSGVEQLSPEGDWTPTNRVASIQVPAWALVVWRGEKLP